MSLLSLFLLCESNDFSPRSTGGIPARNEKGERLLLFLGVIDILQSYRMIKKIEHTFKSVFTDGDTVSVHRPSFYAQRFLDFMANKVFRKIPSRELPTCSPFCLPFVLVLFRGPIPEPNRLCRHQNI